MRVIYRALGAAAGISILAACTSGQSAIQPPSNQVNVQQNSVLQFRVGTVNMQGLQTYFNTVVTFRQANGLSATLYNTPTITGPAGFTVPTVQPQCGDAATAGGAFTASTFGSSNVPPGTDAGTNHISGTQPTQPGTPAVATTFAQVGGAFAYGFAPANSTTGGVAFYPGNPSGRGFSSRFGTVTDVYPQPIYCAYDSSVGTTSTRKRPYVLGPPAVPDFHNPSAGYPAGFAGYDSGFMSFAVVPVAGNYNLTVTVPGNSPGAIAATFNATAPLNTLAPLPTLATPVVAEPGGAGTAVTVTVAPAPAPVTQQVLYVYNQTSGQFFSFNATPGGTFTLSASNFTAGDTIRAYLAGADWDIIGNAPPNNSSQTPTLPTQTDVTFSNHSTFTYS